MVEDMPISNKAIINVFFLPIRSPKCPNMIPPTGLAMNPAAKVPNDRIRAIEGVASGKNA